MVRNKFILALMFLVMILTLGANARASLITLNSGDSATFLYDGASSSPACSLCDATVVLTFNGTSLTITFSNTSSDGLANVNVLTSFAFNSTPDLTFSNPSFSGLPTGKEWEFATTGLGSFEFGSSSESGITDGLEGGESGTLTVDITNIGLTSLIIDDTQTHFQAINTLGGTSTKSSGCVSGTPDCDGTTATTATQVPEPSSMLLLGSGLLAVAGYVRRIRS